MNGKREKANYVLTGGETLDVSLPPEEPLSIIGEDIPLDIVYEDEYLLVINKEAGRVVHPAKGHQKGTLVHALVYYLEDKVSEGTDASRPGIVHRLDKDTSGLLVIAKDDHTHRLLAEAIGEGKVERLYTALVNQPIDIPEGKIDLPLGRDPHHRIRFAVQEEGKPAVTYYKVLKNYSNAALVQAQLITGRTHQIRVHMEYIGHPVVGDPVYRQGLGHLPGVLAAMHEGQLLHASHLAFTHPRTEEEMSFTSPLPDRFKEIMQTLDPLV